MQLNKEFLKDEIKSHEMIFNVQRNDYGGTCSSLVIAAIVTTPGKWKQSRCTSTNEWIIKRQYIYTWNIIPLLRKMRL